MQPYFQFFREGENPPSPNCRNWYLDPSNPESPYYGFVGNENAIKRLVRIDFNALGKFNHATEGLNVAVIGPAGTGKTSLVKRHNRARMLPFVEISPKSVKNTQDLFKEISGVAFRSGVTLEKQNNGFYLPPMDIFIDEVHALHNNMVQGLLKATEPSDSILVTSEGMTVNCKNIHWIIATTDRGKLFDAFDTRFIKIQLHLYDKETMAQIVNAHYPNWSMDVCRLVAHYSSRVPREAIAFAKEMTLEYNMNPGNWESVAKQIACDNEIDPWGMTYQRLKILKALGQHPVSAARLPGVAECKIEELDKFVLPWLLESTPDQAAMVSVSSKGYCITEAGVEQLEVRGIEYNKDVLEAA